MKRRALRRRYGRSMSDRDSWRITAMALRQALDAALEKKRRHVRHALSIQLARAESLDQLAGGQPIGLRYFVDGVHLREIATLEWIGEIRDAQSGSLVKRSEDRYHFGMRDAALDDVRRIAKKRGYVIVDEGGR